MKRHKYVFPKYIQSITKNKELQIAALKYLRDQKLLKNKSFIFCLRNALAANYIPLSKINTYCLVTGRIRYTIKNTQTSRHIFFEYCSSGFIPGFFFSS